MTQPCPNGVHDEAVPVTVELVLRSPPRPRAERDGPGHHGVDVLDVDELELRGAGQATGRGALVPRWGSSSSTMTTASPIWISEWAIVPPGPGNRMRSVAPNTSA